MGPMTARLPKAPQNEGITAQAIPGALLNRITILARTRRNRRKIRQEARAIRGVPAAAMEAVGSVLPISMR